MFESFGGPPIVRQVCALYVMPAPAETPFWVMGDSFLRRVSVVHVLEPPHVVLFANPSDQTEHDRSVYVWSWSRPTSLLAAARSIGVSATALALVGALGILAAILG